MWKPRNHPQTRPSRGCFDQVIAIIKQARIAAKHIDKKCANLAAICIIQHILRAHDLRDHAAAIDVATQHHRHICRLRKPHIGNIPLAQVHLGGAARPFDKNQIILRFQAMKAFENGRH